MAATADPRDPGSVPGQPPTPPRARSRFALPRFEARTIAILVTALLLIFMPGSVPAAIFGVGINALALGIEFDGVGYLASRHFGLKHFGFIYGTMVGLLALTSGIAPWLANLAFDASGTYAALLWSIVPIALISGLLFGTMGRYPVFDKPEAQTA